MFLGECWPKVSLFPIINFIRHTYFLLEIKTQWEKESMKSHIENRKRKWPTYKCWGTNHLKVERLKQYMWKMLDYGLYKSSNFLIIFHVMLVIFANTYKFLWVLCKRELGPHLPHLRNLNAFTRACMYLPRNQKL